MVWITHRQLHSCLKLVS